MLLMSQATTSINELFACYNVSQNSRPKSELINVFPKHRGQMSIAQFLYNIYTSKPSAFYVPTMSLIQALSVSIVIRNLRRPKCIQHCDIYCWLIEHEIMSHAFSLSASWTAFKDGVTSSRRADSCVSLRDVLQTLKFAVSTTDVFADL
jgi:hypothetical protein